MEKESVPVLTKGVLWLMTIGAGLVVANNYYSQPLLGKIAKEFNVPESTVSNIPMFTQIGYAVGLLMLVPLGDMFKRKKIIIIDFIFIILSLLLTATSKSVEIAIIASFFVGLSSVIPQVFVPIAAQLSKPEDKGKNVGIVMSGLLIGILASRVISGRVGEYYGWREMYFIASGIMFVLWIFIILFIPEIKPTFKGTYFKLMKSILGLIKINPSLRLASVRGAFSFGSFLAFFTTLTFRLEQAPFFAGSDVAGDMGLAGIAGAMSASMTGKIANKVNKNFLIFTALILMIISWGIFYYFGNTYIGLILGIILIDMGLQTVHVTNQTIVFSTHPEASNRLNTVYMTTYFIGGALGTFLGGKAWEAFGWNGVVITGLSFVTIGLCSHLIFSKKQI